MSKRHLVAFVFSISFCRSVHNIIILSDKYVEFRLNKTAFEGKFNFFFFKSKKSAAESQQLLSEISEIIFYQ